MKPIITLVILALSFGIFPSFTALSEGAPWGPISVIKLLFPALLVFIWLKRNAIPKQFRILIGSTLMVGTLGTLIAGVSCGFPSALLREWAAICIGFSAALSFWLLDTSSQKRVLIFWAAAIYGSALLDAIQPSAIDWLHHHIFDPATRSSDKNEISGWALSGLFGRQSMAKFLAWIPWLLLGFAAKIKVKRSTFILLILLGMVSAAATLATTQRGPFIGILAGIIAFALHQGFRLGQWKITALGMGALVISVVLSWVIVPRDIYEIRMKSLMGIPGPSANSGIADGNISFRRQMSEFSWKIIKTHPLGNACIPANDFRAAKLFPAHAHNLILQQYRERGWAWGTLHLLLWLLALIGAWQTRTPRGSFLLGGLTTTLVLGMVDHPWFVINHAMILSLFILQGFEFYSRTPIHKIATPGSSA